MYPDTAKVTKENRLLSVALQDSMRLQVYTFDLEDSSDSKLYNIQTYENMANDILTQHYIHLPKPSIVFCDGLWGEALMFTFAHYAK